MSRLDSFIRRLEAQRRCLDWAAAAIDRRPGIVLELGLGNGRTFDHLRDRVGARRAIVAFDRKLAAHPACVPPRERLVLGELRDTLPRFIAKEGPCAALVHADLGSGDARATARLARWLAARLAAVLLDDALVLSDQELKSAALTPVALPRGVPAGRYFVYRKAPAVRRARGRRSPARGRSPAASRARP